MPFSQRLAKLNVHPSLTNHSISHRHLGDAQENARALHISQTLAEYRADTAALRYGLLCDSETGTDSSAKSGYSLRSTEGLLWGKLLWDVQHILTERVSHGMLFSEKIVVEVTSQ